MREYDFDAFISYSHRDKAWVHGVLLKGLEQAGLKICIDFRDFEPGKPSLFNMQRAARRSRRMLLVMTQHWFASEWTLFESLLGATQDPAGLRPRIIPLLRESSEMPEDADFIAALTYVDFTNGADPDLAWRQLLTALGKTPELPPPKEPEPNHWFLAHPYPMPPNFTGRAAEREMLTQWLNNEPTHPLFVLRALGGFGKSALTWHWLTHDVNPAAWPRVVWWSFYEGDTSFDHFLAETLNFLSDGKVKPDRLSINEVRALLKILRSPGILLVLEGFERALRVIGRFDAANQGDEVAQSTISDPKSEMNQCDCISPLAEDFLRNVALQPKIRSRVLLTTRLCPRVLEAQGGGLLQGCCEEELSQMQPADAVEFFHAQGIRGTRAEIEQACAPYGYHPLSLRILAGLIVGDFMQPGDIAAAHRIDVSGDLIRRQHHVLETAYNSLTPYRRRLLSRIACFSGSLRYETLKSLAETEGRFPLEKQGQEKWWPRWLKTVLRIRTPVVENSAHKSSEDLLNSDLGALVTRGLLHHDRKECRFDLHPIVRRYAYDRLAVPDRAAAHTSLCDYFAAVPNPSKVTCLEDLTPVIELYHHTVRAWQLDEAWKLFYDRIHDAIYYQFGAYQLIIEMLRALFPDGEDRPPRLKDEKSQAWALVVLANSYSLNGQPSRAVTLFEASNDIDEKLGDKCNLAIGLGNLAQVQIPIGTLRAAEVNLRRSIALCREIKDERSEAIGHQELGHLLAYRGVYAYSEPELQASNDYWKKSYYIQGQCVDEAYRTLCELLRLRSVSDSPLARCPSPLDCARRALELADETARTRYPHEHDYVRSHWMLGAAFLVAGQDAEAERHLHEALERCRRINLVEFEADILIDLARLRAATGSPDEVRRLAEEALLITERCGYVLQGADAHLELAKFARTRGDFPTALDHAREARRLATCDGPPDYTYHAAYTEAGALLAELGD